MNTIKLKMNLKLINFYEEINLPKKFTFKNNKNKIKSNLTKKQFKNKVLKSKKIH